MNQPQEQLALNLGAVVEDEIPTIGLSHLEEQQLKLATNLRITLAQYKYLALALRTEDLVSCVELLAAKKPKSPFRKWCSEGIRAWLNAGGEKEQFPLTKTQLLRIAPTWPCKYQIPRN